MFQGLHQRLDYLYACDCPDCKAKYQTLANNSGDNILLDIAEKAFKKIYKTGYDVKNLFKTSEFKSLLIAIKNKFNLALIEGIQDNDVPPEMLKALQQDVYIFSSIKTHAQLYEASRNLIDENGKVRSFQQFEQSYKQINEAYNKNYLEAEYEFAVASAQTASNWADIEKNKGRYNLQYRTAGDESVRQSHRELNGITLPADDGFWNLYYPPNGWRCRCNAIEVLKDKYEESDAKEASKKADKATTEIGKNGVNRLEIFRFNSGKDKVIFPPHHPYHKVQEANTAKKLATEQAEKTALREAKQAEIFAKPLAKQYSKIFTDKKSGGTVKVHDYVEVGVKNGDDDYDSVIQAAKLFAKKGEQVLVLPKIYKTETEARALILEGYSFLNKHKNPDLKVGNLFMDVKRPDFIDNVKQNGLKACTQQDCTAIISDNNIGNEDLLSVMPEQAKAILKNPAYKKDNLYFVINNVLYEFSKRKKG